MLYPRMGANAILPHPELDKALRELRGDADTFLKVLPRQPPAVAVLGSARSSPRPGESGHLDYAWTEELGRELRVRRLVPATGAGPGSMEAALKGFKAADEAIKMGALLEQPVAPGPRSEWDLESELHGELFTQGGNLALALEQLTNPYVDRLATFERFLFRMEFLFRNKSAMVVTPGGFGTLAELFSYLALKEEDGHEDAVILGAPDEYWERLAQAFAPLCNPWERKVLSQQERSPQKAVERLAQRRRKGWDEDPRAMIDRMMSDLEEKLAVLAEQPPAVTFIAGTGPRSEMASAIAEEIACRLTKAYVPVRVDGSSWDAAVVAGARRGNRRLEPQAFSLEKDVKGSSNPDPPDVHYHPVDDLLVLRELLTGNARGLVVAAEGVRSLSLALMTACDIQTEEMPQVPIVVIDPDGAFGELQKTFRDVLCSDQRQYVTPEELAVFSVVKTAEEALKLL